MSNEEIKESDETQDIQEDIQEDQGSTQEETNDTPSKEDFEKLKKERETLLAQKEHWRKKAETPSNKNNASNELPTRDDIRIMAKMSDEEIDQLEIISKGQGVSLKEASASPMFVSFQKDLKAKAKAEKAQLGTSGGSAPKNEPDISKMTREEHEAYARKLLEK